MMKRKVKAGSLCSCLLAIATVAVCLFPGNCFGTTFYTRQITAPFLGFGSGQWYDATAGEIDLNGAGIFGGALYAHGVSGVFLDLANATFNFTAAKERDYSSGNLAKGYFEGSVEVEIVGKLKQGSTTVYDGTIFKAVLTPVYEDSANPGVDSWALEEAYTNAGHFDRTLENVQMVVTLGDGLGAGIDLGGGDILMMTGPKIDLSLKSSPNPVAFNQNLNHATAGSNIMITGVIPEPATVLVLGLGALLVRRKK